MNGGRAYVLSLVATAAVLLLQLALTSRIGQPPMPILFVIPIVVGAYCGGLGPGLLATVLAASAAKYFVIPPTHSFEFAQPADLVPWSVLILLGVLISVLIGALRRRAGESRPAQGELVATERKVRLGFAVALACLAVIGIVSYLSVERLNENAASVRHTYDVLGGLELLLAAATDSETAERGYVITGDESYLEPYRQSAAVIDADERRLRGLIADNRTQRQLLNSVMSLVGDRLENLRKVIEMRRNDGFDAAQIEVQSGRGKQYHDQIRRLIDEMKAAETSLLTERELRTHRSSTLTQGVILGGGVLGCTIVGLALLSIRRDFAGRTRAERALHEANDQLEVRVQQRTEQLTESHERMRAIFDAALDGIVTMDHEGRLAEFNPAAEGIFGYRREDVLGLALAEVIIPPELRDRHRAGLARYLATGDAVVLGKRMELMGMRADGSLVAVELCINRMPGDGPPSFAGFLRDVTERRKAAEVNARLASIVQFSDDAIVSKNLDGVITSWNPAAERLFGHSSREAVGQSMNLVIPPERSSEELIILARIARGETTDHFETVRIAKDGRKIDVSATISPIRDSHGRIVGASKIVRDITDRKLAERKLRAQLVRLDLLQQITRAIGERQDIQSIFQVVIRTLEEQLPADFCCIGLHDAAENSLIVTSVGLHSELIATQLAMTKQARIEIDENELAQCMRGRLIYEPDVSQVPSPFPQRLAGGTLRSMVAAPLLVESKVFGVLIAARRAPHSFSSGDCEFLRQLSEHVALAANQAETHAALQRAYDDLRQTQQAILQQERLRALGEMASGIAHDINNALSPVALYTDALLERERQLSAQGRGHLQVIQRAVDDVAQTVARMREFYRHREPQLTLAAIQMNRLVDQVIDLTRARWCDIPQQNGVVIQMERDLLPDLPDFMGVESEVRDALTNLMFNAVDAMPAGGHMTLRTGIAPDDAGIYVEVCDSGIGMDEDTRRRCLEPFFTTKGERGTGLGLAMVYGMVQRHGADIDVRSMPGLGTTVRVSFSRQFANAPADGGPTAPVSALPRLRILVVDDDPLLLKSLRDILEADGHEVTTANGGQEGIEEFRAALERGDTFAAVISDLGMPYVDGRKVSNAIKDLSPSTPVILLTGWGQRLIAEGDVPAHVDLVLGKPPKINQLREALRVVTQLQVS